MTIESAAIFAFLRDDIGVETDDLDEATLLFSTGLIDSFALINLISFIEEEAGIRVSPADVNLDNLDSVERILAYVAQVSG